MTPEEMSDLYIRIAFHYESTIDRLVGKGLSDPPKRLEVRLKLCSAT